MRNFYKIKTQKFKEIAKLGGNLDILSILQMEINYNLLA